MSDEKVPMVDELQAARADAVVARDAAVALIEALDVAIVAYRDAAVVGMFDHLT